LRNLSDLQLRTWSIGQGKLERVAIRPNTLDYSALCVENFVCSSTPSATLKWLVVHEVSDTKRDCKPSVLFEEFATGFLCGSQRAILCRLEGRSYAQILWLAGSQSGCAVLLPRNIRSKKVHLAS